MIIDITDPQNRIRQAQLMLRSLSFAYDEPYLRANVTGDYDSRTRRAVNFFQEKNKIPVTGVVDLRTWNELARQYNHQMKLRQGIAINPIGMDYDFQTTPGERSDTVYILQILLNTLSRDYGMTYISPSGIYGRQTADAVKYFQEKNNLPVTGVADVTTWQRLAEEYNRQMEQ